MKICTKCNQELPLTEFYRAKTNKNGSICYQGRCKSCMNKDNLTRYKNLTPEEKKEKQKRNVSRMGRDYFKGKNLLRNYGLSLDEFKIMYEKQNGSCFLCETPIEGRQIKVDHNHKTGKVRKLLCHKCNTSLGLLDENPKLFYKCAEYLKEHNDNFQEGPLA
jgi:hypothetical protein